MVAAAVIDKPQLAMVLEMTRTRRGFTQRYMAKRCNCSESMIAMVESGEREPTLKMLRVWARETGQASLIALVSGAYIGDEPAELVELVEENVRLRTAVRLVQG